MAWRSRTSLIVTLLVPLFLIFDVGSVRAGDLNTPVRIEIQPRVREAAVGGKIDYAVSLRNALGEAVAAPKQMTIDVQATLPSGQMQTQQVTIEPGATDAHGTVPVSETGAIPIDASNPELIGGGVVVFGKPLGSAIRGIVLPMRSSSVTPRNATVASTMEALPGAEPDREPLAEAATAASAASPSPAAASASVAVPPPPRAAATAGATPPPPAAVATEIPASGTPDPEPALEVPASHRPPSDSGEARTLMLYVPETEILADGRNGAEVTVYLDPCSAMSDDVVVRLAVTKGHLDPNIVTIPRGECSASTTWRSDRMSLGDATLSILVSSPHLRPGDKIVRSFVPPIHSLRLTPNPGEITLLERGDVLAELHDDVNDVPVSTDRPMKVTLALREGNGALRPLEMTFDKGDSTTRASFQPTYWGKVVVAGQIPYRLEEQAVFTVKSGFGVFLLSLVGGLIGGLLAYRAKKEKPLRILIGLVTGFALFAFFLFFGAENILEVTGGLNLLNPVSVFLLSLAGGWAGTNVLAWALKRIGIEA